MSYGLQGPMNGRGLDPWDRDGGRRSARYRRGGVEIGTMDYPSEDPLRWWTVLRRQAGFALAVFLLVVAATLAGTALKAPMYRAAGLMEIRRASSDVVAVDALFDGESPSRDYLDTQQGLLRSYALAARVVQDVHLDQVDEFSSVDEDAPASGTATASLASLQPVVDKFHERLVISGGAGGRLVRVQFDAEDPELAADVVNSVLDNFVAMRVDGGEEASEWLSVQLDEARTGLESAERDLQDYAQANGLPLARGEEDVAANVQERLDALEADLIDARTERLAAQARSVTLVDEGGSEAVNSAVLDDLSLRISELKREHAQLSSTFRDDYPEVSRLAREISALEERRAEEVQRLARGVTGEYRSALQREQLVEQAVSDEASRSDSLMTRTAGYRILSREVDANRERYGALREKLMEAEVATAVSGVDVDVVDRAMPPVEPYSPSWPISIVFAFVGGTVLAIGAVFARDYMSPRARTAQEVGASVNAPVLAVIPSARRGSIPDRGVGGRAARPRLDRPGRGRAGSERGLRANGDAAAASRSRAISDAMGSLRAAVLFEQGPAAARSILVTSSISGEGKTTVAVNFAISLANMGRDVLLVDADMRRPCVHQVLETGARGGLVQYLDGTEVEWPVLVSRDHMPGLDVLVAGGQPAAPESLLASTRFGRMLDEAQALYDFVVIDGPALFIDAPDARIMAEQVDGVVAVVRNRTTPQSVLQPVLSAVPNLLGVILNDLDADDFPDEHEAGEAEQEWEAATAGTNGRAPHGDSGPV